MMNGHQFEEQLTDSLRRLGCVVTTSPTWDIKEKTDQLIPKVNGARRHLPFVVQITLNRSDPDKLQDFLQTIDIGRRAVFVYIEFTHRRSELNASAELRLLQRIASLRPKAGQVFGAVIAGAGSYEIFNPWNRVNQRFENQRRRTDGFIAEVGSDFMVILNGKTLGFHVAERANVKDRRLLELMKLGRLPRRYKVSFTPGRHGHMPMAYDLILAR
ncbi:hypothetical protein HY633_01860 [Candidatus Uhrbacteria bacterium]|nr:hypothetical protein [Candidatus Uhrbacteria bacterium]